MIWFVGPLLNWRRLCRAQGIDPLHPERQGVRRVVNVEGAKAADFKPGDRLLVVPAPEYREVVDILRAKRDRVRFRRPDDDGPVFGPDAA